MIVDVSLTAPDLLDWAHFVPTQSRVAYRPTMLVLNAALRRYSTFETRICHLHEKEVRRGQGRKVTTKCGQEFYRWKTFPIDQDFAKRFCGSWPHFRLCRRCVPARFQ